LSGISRARLDARLAEHQLKVGEEFFLDNLLVRIHFIIVMIRWTGLAPWEFEFPFPGSFTSTFLATVRNSGLRSGFHPEIPVKIRLFPL